MEKYNHLMSYEKEVMNVLLSSPVLAELCKNREVDEDEISSLKWVNYFPSLYIEDTITETEAYVLYNFDIQENYVADTYFDGKLIFQVFCHKDILYFFLKKVQIIVQNRLTPSKSGVKMRNFPVLSTLPLPFHP